MGAFDDALGRVGSALNDRLPSASAIGSAIVGGAVGRFAPRALQAPLQRALRGDMSGAISSAALGFLGGEAAKVLGRNALLGGMSMSDVQRLVLEANSIQFAKKNLFLIEIEDQNPPGGAGDISYTFNMFATDVSFSPQNIIGDAVQIGMTAIDQPTGIEKIDLHITTYDDTDGVLQKWFSGKCAQIAHRDGTVGLPTQYLLQINLVQSATDDIGAALFGGCRSSFVVRPGSIEVNCARSEDALAQLQMTFHQFDPFITSLPAAL